MELVELPNHQALILVRKSILRNLRGAMETIPLADGRALIEFRGPHGIADLELAILDGLASPGLDAESRAALTQARETLKSLRLDRKLR
jgi:hypothetical protein